MAKEPKLNPGSNICYCTACKSTFKSVGGFTKHRSTNDGLFRCMSAKEMQDKGMSKNELGQWIMSAYEWAESEDAA